MHQSLALLRWEAPDLPPRHRSLHATLDWSYALLTAHQQALFRRLAVFAGGFTLEGAEAVFTGDVPGADDGAGDGLFYRHPEPPPRPPAALDDLAALVDHSLVQPVDPVAEEPRYRMLETVRQFGLEQLAASGEEGEVRRRHLVYFVALAEHLSERLWLPQAERVLARLDAEHDDVRAALAWAEASGEAALGLRLARAMINFWAVRGHLREGQGWLERALRWGAPSTERAGSRPSAERAKALVGLGWLARFQGDSDRAEPAFGEALRVASEVGARMTAARALSGLALVDLDRGRYAEAAARLDEALARYQELEPALVAGPVYVSQTLLRRGEAALAGGDLAGAARYLEEAERRQRALGFAWGLSETLRYLGDLARARGDLDAALGRYRESLALAGERGDPRLAAAALDGVAGVAAARGQAERAARLYGAAAALREHLGATVVPWEHPARERDLAAARAALEPAAFEAAWAAGAALPLEAAVAEALADDASRGRAPATRRRPCPIRADALGLTPREIDVLRAAGARALQPRDRGSALHQPAHRQLPRHQPAGQARARLPRRRRRLRRPPRAGLSPLPTTLVNLTGPPPSPRAIRLFRRCASGAALAS